MLTLWITIKNLLTEDKVAPNSNNNFLHVLLKIVFLNIFIKYWQTKMGLPWLHSGKESLCQRRFNPWVRKIPWKEMATHSSIFAWEISWAGEPGRLQSMGLQRVRHDLSSKNRKGQRQMVHVSLENPVFSSFQPPVT